MPHEVHYSDYLQLDKILNAQEPESDKQQQPAHDEMLFIVIHQAYELWFKQLLFETESVIAIMKQPALNDNSPELQTIAHRLSRCGSILKVLVHQIDIMETMTPMDFLDFRDKLRPASGFQSWQFKLLEARLGLKYEQRFGQAYYVSQLRQPQIDLIKAAEKDLSLLELINRWLERMPYFAEPEHWKDFTGASFWTEYRLRYQQSLADSEKNNLEWFDQIFGLSSMTNGGTQPTEDAGRESAVSGPQSVSGGCPFGQSAVSENIPIADIPANIPIDRSLSPAACRAALFIMLYRGYPILQLPFQVLNQLLEIDEQMSTWRYRHMSMVHRMIGTRIGTGGSTGKDYLKAAMDKHHLFKEIAGLTSFLIERRRLPALSPEMERRLGFVG
jgi:tryptophan 2,3-dioxygenase